MAEGKHTAGALDRFDSIGHSIAFAEACLMHGSDAATAKRAADDLHQALADVGAIRELAPSMLEALKLAEQFIANGVELGFIRMPEFGDPALDTLPAIRTAISRANGGR